MNAPRVLLLILAIAVAIITVSHTVKQASAGAITRYEVASTSNALSPVKIFVITNGDSRVAGNIVYPYNLYASQGVQTAQYLSYDPTFQIGNFATTYNVAPTGDAINLGLGSEQLCQRAANLNNTSGPFGNGWDVTATCYAINTAAPADRLPVVSLLEAYNDFVTGGASAETVYGCLVSYMAQLRACATRPFKMFCMGDIAGSADNYVTQVTAFNTLVAAAPANVCDYYYNFTNDPSFGIDGGVTDTYYIDGTHPSICGNYHGNNGSMLGSTCPAPSNPTSCPPCINTNDLAQPWVLGMIRTAQLWTP
jgi:hypothetical protein